MGLGSEEAGKENGGGSDMLKIWLYSHERHRWSGERGEWTPSSSACCVKWGRSFFLLNIVSILLEIQMIKSTNQRMDVWFSNSSPGGGDSLEWPLPTVPSAPTDLSPSFLHSWWSAQQPTPSTS